MPIQFRHRHHAGQPLASGREKQIEAEFIHLFFKQSSLGIPTSLINACALSFLLRHQVGHRVLGAWLFILVLLAGLRAMLIHCYRKRDVPFEQAGKWGRWNIAGLAISGFLWAMGVIVIFPVHSLVHQLCMAFIICGVVTGSASLYAGVPLAFRAFSLAPLVMLIARFLIFNDQIHMVVAGLAAVYLTLMVLATQSIARTRRQLLLSRIELSSRVAERTRALQAANSALKREIQERRKIEERLRVERDRLEIITTTIGAGLAVISKKYRILWANGIFRETFGEVQGKLCYQSQYQRENVCDKCGVREVFEQGLEKATHEQEHRDTGGNLLWFQIVTTPIRNREGRIRAALEMVLPITERKQAESSSQRMSEQLEEARKTEAIATLAGGIAHQFNNALAVIAGNIELLEHDFRHESQIKNYSRPISNAADRMTQLTNQLLAYAKGGKYKELPNDLSSVTETTLDLIKHTIAPHITVAKQLGKDLPSVKIDITQIQMVISAIVANAAEAITGQGVIAIACGEADLVNEKSTRYGSVPPGRYVVLTIQDNGAGMDDLTMKRIFEPFFTTKFQGRGLGMAAVFGIIRNHGGYLNVMSQTGKGTEVEIYLPAVTEVADTREDPAQPYAHGSGTVFLIEDDPGVVDVNRTWLRRLGYEVLVAATAAQAIRLIRRSSQAFDVVLLDLVLPDLGGAAIYPLIRQHRPSAKIIVCSGYGLDGPTQELLDAGADGFIQKPYTLADIEETIRQVMPSRQPSGPQGSN
jgi:two-component system, cell cycle sensor histidine kinase and response regulator CckA